MDTEANRRFSLRNIRNIRTFSSLKNPVYRIYYGALLGQMAAMNMNWMTNSLLMYRLTNSATLLGVLALGNALPQLFLGLLGGAIADRVQKKYVLLVGQASFAVVALGVALAMTLGYMSAERAGSWWILVTAAVLQGSIMGLMMPSRQAMIREIVSNEQLMNAVALTNLGMNVLRIMAPAIAGFLIDSFGFKAIYFTMTGLYITAVVFASFLPLTSRIADTSRNALDDIKEGLKYVGSDTTIILVLLFTLIVVVLAMPYMQLMPIFIDDILKVGASGMGVLISVSGVGAITASVTLASLPNKKRGVMLLASGLILGVALVGFSFSSSWYLSMAFVLVVGIGQTGRMTLGNTLLQYYVEDEYRGRVMSIYLMEWGLTSFSTFFAALLADSIGVQWAVGGFAVLLVFLSILTIALVPQLRKLD